MSNQAQDGTILFSPKRIMVSTKRVACDGGGGALGHPKTWLDMGQGGSVTCKYCGRLFVWDEDATPSDGH